MTLSTIITKSLWIITKSLDIYKTFDHYCFLYHGVCCVLKVYTREMKISAVLTSITLHIPVLMYPSTDNCLETCTCVDSLCSNARSYQGIDSSDFD